MPIRSDYRDLYPPDWAEISKRVRFDWALGRCERCRRRHKTMVLCLPDGRWLDTNDGRHLWIDGNGNEVGFPLLAELLDPATGEPRTRIHRVVVTCAHLDHDPGHNDPANLAALCNRCHLLHDAAHHLRQRRLTWLARHAIGDLFRGLYSALVYPFAGDAPAPDPTLPQSIRARRPWPFNR